MATSETQPFWDAAREGTLLVKVCTACGAAHWYPRALCPFCFGATAWKESAGTGTIYSYSVMRRVPRPYAIAYVTLDEGVTMMTNVVGCELDDVRIGMRVRVVFVPSAGDEPPLPMFSPIDASTA